MVTLEGQKYVTVSLVIPMVEHIHKGLHEVHECLKELGTVIGTQILPDGQEFHMENILESMIEDFESRRADGSDINTYSLDTSNTNKDQPCGYTVTETQVIYFTLDPRMVDLSQVDEEQAVSVWKDGTHV